MKVALNICLALVLGFSVLYGLRACEPFSYFTSDGSVILKGAVEK